MGPGPCLEGPGNAGIRRSSHGDRELLQNLNGLSLK